MKMDDETKKAMEGVAGLIAISEYLTEATVQYLADRQIVIEALKLKGMGEKDIDAVMAKVQQESLKIFDKVFEEEIRHDKSFKAMAEKLAESSIRIITI